MRAFRVLTGGRRLNVASVQNLTSTTLLRTVNVLDRGVSQPDEMHVRDAESSNLSLRD